MPQMLFPYFWCVPLFILLRLGGFVDIDELPPVLRPWFRVHPGYLDDLTLVWSTVRTGDPLVGLTVLNFRLRQTTQKFCGVCGYLFGNITWRLVNVCYL